MKAQGRPNLASSISLYVSDNPEGSDEVLGPAGAVFPDQEARPVI